MREAEFVKGGVEATARVDDVSQPYDKQHIVNGRIIEPSGGGTNETNFNVPRAVVALQKKHNSF
ncbi:hypothetical protein MY5147_009027 [Beauveria neobassiana]